MAININILTTELFIALYTGGFFINVNAINK